MARNDSLTRAGLSLATIALLTAAIAAATSLVLTSRLSNEDALRSDMDTIITSVSAEAVANTESFLLPAVRTSDYLSAFISDGVLELTDPDAQMLLLDIVDSNDLFEGIYIGSARGEFIYANRGRDSAGQDSTFSTKKITFPDGARDVTISTYDLDMNLLSTESDRTDVYDPRSRVWYTAAADSDTGAWTDPYLFFTSGLPGVTHASPVRIDGQVEYVVGVDVGIAELSTFMAERAPSPNGGAFIVTKSQKMVAYSDPTALEDGNALRFAFDVDDPALQLAAASIQADDMTSAEQRTQIAEVNGTPAQFVFTHLKTNSDWVVTAWSPTSDFLAQVRGTQRTNTLIALGLGVVILIELLGLAMWVFRRLVKNHELLVASEAASEQSSLERDLAQTKLAQTVEQLAASNRDLEQYAYAAAHDLRTPLRAIGGYSELIGREVSGEEVDLGQVRAWSDQIVAGYDRMGRTMDNLLEHARISQAVVDLRDIECIDTNPVANAVVDDLTVALQSTGGRVVIGKLPRARIDAVQLSRVFQNLLENAIRFRDPTRPLVVHIDGFDHGYEARFRISDNGIGISDTDRLRIFESFSQAHESSGVGLGLSLVHRIVEDHGGEIKAESEVGIGSTFEVSLPSKQPVHTS